ncbi:MAG: hypothetical protein K2Q01_02480, partial [Rickettsiales bacterium]|nr:hypothetical protein [Rickettsiales bacterium]
TLGRKSYGDTSNEVQEFLLSAKGKKHIPLGEGYEDPASMVGIYRSAANSRVSEGGMSYSVYCDPRIEPYVRENIPSNLTPDKSHWPGVDEALKILHMRSEFTNRYAFKDLLKELHAVDGKLTLTASDGNATPRRTRQCLGQFATKGGISWHLDPKLLGQAITAGMIRARVAEIEADPARTALMAAERERGRKTKANPSPHAQPFAHMLDAYISGGGTDWMELMLQYQQAHGLSHTMMADRLGVDEERWRAWRNHHGEEVRAPTLDGMAEKLELDPAHARSLRELAHHGHASPIADIVKEFRGKFKELRWQERNKRAALAGQCFDRLMGSYPNQHAADEIGVNVATLRGWRQEIKPERTILEKADEIGRLTSLVPDTRYARPIADLLVRGTVSQVFRAPNMDELY